MQDHGPALLVAAEKQPLLRQRQSPEAAQDAQQPRRKHGGAVLGAITCSIHKDHSTAIDIAASLTTPKPATPPLIRGGDQSGARLEPGYRFEKPHTSS
jgi:hypothetical protein